MSKNPFEYGLSSDPELAAQKDEVESQLRMKEIFDRHSSGPAYDGNGKFPTGSEHHPMAYQVKVDVGGR